MWTQNYDPFGNWMFSTAVAAVPVVVLLGLLLSGKVGAWQSALAGLVSAMGLAVGAFGMPARMALAAAGYGAVFAIFRIIWLIVAAVFLYDIAVKTGQFDVMKRSIAGLTADRRLQAVLIAFGFGAFVEGCAGFGAPVAITASFLVGLGFRPLQAAVLCLIANTAPVAWGSIGIPIRTLATVTGLDVEALSATSGRILPILSLIVPFWLVRAMVGWRETFAVWPALLTMGGTFAVAQFAWSNFVGFELVDIVSAVASLVGGIALLKVWKPRTIWRFPEDSDRDAEGPRDDGSPLTASRVARAWMPFGVLTAMVLLWGTPPIKRAIDAATTANPPLEILHYRVAKGEAVTGPASLEEKAKAQDKYYEKAVMDLVPVSATGTAVFLAGAISGSLLGLGPVAMMGILIGTMRRLIPAMAAILSMLALGFVTKYSGMDAVLGLAFTRAGPTLYPIFGTFLGWLGVALTGSDTSSNVLFGNLQTITARKLGLSPILMASANTTGGVMGKMIDAQSIVVAAAASGEAGKEGEILRAVIGHSVALALIVAAIVWAYAHIFPGMVAIPPGP